MPKRKQSKTSDKTETKKSKAEETPKAKKETKTKKGKKASIREVLSTTKASDLTSMMKDGQTISIEANASVYNAILALTHNKILSAPVLSPKTKKCIGFVDMVDLVAATVQAANEATKDKDSSEAVDDDGENMIEKMIMDNMVVNSIIDFSKRDDFITIKETETALKAVELLTQKDHHRIAIINDADELVGIVTQSGLSEYISEEFAEVIDKDDTKLKDMELPKEVHSVNEKISALDAFKTIKDKRVSGLAVVNDSGKLIEAISVSDLMLFTEWIAGGVEMRFTDLTGLNKSVMEFLQNSRAQREMTSKKPMTCPKGDRVCDAMETMLVNHIHRLFIVDSAGHPSSIITYDSILKHLLTLPKISL